MERCLWCVLFYTARFVPYSAKLERTDSAREVSIRSFPVFCQFNKLITFLKLNLINLAAQMKESELEMWHIENWSPER